MRPASLVGYALLAFGLGLAPGFHGNLLPDAPTQDEPGGAAPTQAPWSAPETGQPAKPAPPSPRPPKFVPYVRTPIEELLNRTFRHNQTATLDAWFVLAGTASPSGALTGYELEIPQGMWDQTATSSNLRRVLTIEAVPLVVRGSPDITEWVLVPFVLQGGAPRVPPPATYNSVERTPSYFHEGPISAHDQGLADATTRTLGASLVPSIRTAGLPAGGNTTSLFFVLGARSDATTDFGIALRLYPGDTARPSASLDEFLESAGSARPLAVPVRGHGEGFLGAVYHYSSRLVLGPEILVRSERIGHAVELDDRTRVRDVPLVTVRETNVSSRFDVSQGWTYVRADYFGDCATGTWSSRIDANGHTYSASGVVLQHALCTYVYLSAAEELLVGHLELQFEGEGAGDARAFLDLRVSNLGRERLDYVHLSLGTALPDLIGHHAWFAAVSMQGLVGEP